MNISKQCYIIGILMIVLVLSGGAGLGCMESKPIETPSDVGSMAIARVGDVELTMEDLISKPQLYSVIDDGLIMQEIIRQEAARRGIVIEQETIQGKVDEFYEMQGGYEVFMENMGNNMPLALIPEDVRVFITNQEMQQAILNDVWATDHGPVSDEEITEYWSINESRLRMMIAGENEIEEAEVTMEMALEMIEEDLKNQWMSENAMTFFTDLRENSDVEFYLRDMLEEREEVVVPLVPEDEVIEETPEDEVIEDIPEDEVIEEIPEDEVIEDIPEDNESDDSVDEHLSEDSDQ